jgi:hypothetical protein
MKMLKQLLFIFPLTLLVACQDTQTCENADIEKFDSYLNLDRNTLETELKIKLGEFTGGYYSDDNRQFIYNFFAVPDAPVSVVVNASSTKVETVMMEVLTFEEDFQKDLAAAIKAYTISECDSRFFGMQKHEIVDEMGEPTDEKVLDGNVTSIEYFSKDYKTSVNFKFYPEQQNMCSSVIVNWYH